MSMKNEMHISSFTVMHNNTRQTPPPPPPPPSLQPKLAAAWMGRELTVSQYSCRRRYRRAQRVLLTSQPTVGPTRPAVPDTRISNSRQAPLVLGTKP